MPFFIFLKNFPYQILPCFFFSHNKKILKKIKENNIDGKVLNFWPRIKSKTSLFFILFFSPLICVYLFFFLFILKKKKSLDYIIVFDDFDKIFLTRIAKILKIKTIAFFCPENMELLQKIKIISQLEKNAALKNICCSGKAENQLSQKGFVQVKNIGPGIKFGLGHQDNIFSELAQEKNKQENKKFFSMGTVLDLNKKHNLETIFQGLKLTQTVIPNLQFIVIGDGEERKNLQWLAKQIGIETIVWFVGEQKNLKKWLDNLDLYIFANNQPKLFDLNYALLGMSSAVPMILPKENCLHEFVNNFKEGLLLEEDKAERNGQE